MKKQITISAMALVFTLAMTGCVGASATDEPAAGDNRPSDAAVAEDVVEEDAAEEVEAPPKFGESYEWEDGLTITVGAPEAFTPSEYSVVTGAAAHLAFTITIVNGSTANVDPGAYITVQSANAEAEEVYDSESGITGTPSTTLLPGREAVFKVAFGVQDPADLVMEVTPGFNYDAVIYTN